MASKTYKLHTDPGHGWLAVRCKELAELGIADKITSFSYVKGEMAYLEEDLDLAVFVDAYRAKHGADPVYTESYRERTFVRNCMPYSAGEVIKAREVVITVPSTAILKLSSGKAKVKANKKMTEAEAAKVRAEFNAQVKAAYEAN
jgi:hypothetical protein